MTHKFRITETRVREVSIEANSYEEAKEKIEYEYYDKESIRLTEDDITEINIENL